MRACKLDFRDPQLGPGDTEVWFEANMRPDEIIVPPDLQVECSGIGIMGSFDHRQTVDSTTDPEAPVIRVTGLCLMGSAEVLVRYPGETAREARLRLKAKKKALRQIAKGKYSVVSIVHRGYPEGAAMQGILYAQGPSRTRPESGGNRGARLVHAGTSPLNARSRASRSCFS